MNAHRVLIALAKRHRILAAFVAVLAVVLVVVFAMKRRTPFRVPSVPGPGQSYIEPPFPVIDPKVGPWKNNNRWGDKRDIAMPAENERVPVFDANEIVGPPRVQSIQLYLGTQQPGTNADFRAQIEYGVGALNGEFQADWTDGAQFSILANWVRINAIAYRPNPVSAYDPSAGRISIGAAVTEGTVTPTRSLTFTESKLIEAPATSATFESPKFTRAVMVYGPDPAVVVDFIGAGALNPFAGTVADFAAFRDWGMAWPGGMVRIFVSSVAPPQTITVTWFLGL